MRKLLFLILGLMLIALPKAQASVTNMTAQLGVYNSTDTQYGLEVDKDNVFTFAPTGSGIKYPGSVKTTNATLTALQTGQTFVMTGTADNTMFTLPTAAVGLTYTFVDDTTKYIQIAPQSTDTINFASIAIGTGIKNSSSTAKGDMIQLFCAVANKWSVSEHFGTWSTGP